MSQPMNFRIIKLTLGAANVPVKLSQTQLIATSFDLFIPSTGSVCYLGDKDVSSDWIPSAPGSLTNCIASEESSVTEGDYFDLSKIYLVSATAGATARIRYLAQES